MIRSHESGSIKAELVCIGTGAKMNKLLQEREMLPGALLNR